MGKPRTPKGRARETNRRLTDEYPDARCELDHRNPYELLAATILSAQCTDARVNMVTPHLFARYPTPDDLAHADPVELEDIIRSTGFYKNKARSLLGMANALVDRYGGEVPGAMEDLVTIPGVGRKTANVVRSVDLGLPGLPVDTHSEVSGRSYRDGKELGAALRENDEVGRCLVRQFYRHANARLDLPADEGPLAALTQRFAASGYRFRSLILALVQSEAFRYAAPPEVQP